ncbi:MAG TPA: PriCT-2 domain-containing protein [Pirellulales bacterium]|jgi:hypothetical protein|nr:PriCT-2 domain-containing protein [Pirellulales bacterium]
MSVDLTATIAAIPLDVSPVYAGSDETPDIQRIGAALFSLRPSRADNYDEWLRVGMALKSAGDHHFPLWDAWSRQSGKYDGDTRRVWDSITSRSNGITLGSLYYWAREDSRPATPEQTDTDPPTFKLLTCTDLDRGDFAVDYLIDDILVAGQPTLCGGGAKMLKTSICLDGAIALTTGTPFLGRFPVLRQARTLVMSGESGLGTIQETARRICRSRGVKLDTIKDLLWSEELPRCDKDIDLVRLDRTLRNTKTEVLVIDPAYLCLGGDDHGDVFKQGQLLGRVNQVCVDNGAAIILCHHNKKSAQKSKTPPQLEDMAMAGFGEFARQWWLLGRREPFCAGEPHALWLNVGGSAGHCGLYQLDIAEGSRKDPGGRKWEVDVTDHHAAKDADSDADVQAVCKVLEAHPGGLTVKPIVEAAGLSRKRVEAALESPTFAQSQIPHPQSKSKTIKGWRLATTAA